MERGPQSGPREQAPAPLAGRTRSDGQYCFVAPRSPRSSSGVRRSSDRAPEPQPGALDATVAQRPEARSPAPAPMVTERSDARAPAPDSSRSPFATLRPPRPLPVTGAVIAGRYRIERVLQVGGMGAVMKAHDLRLGIDVAVKFIRSELVAPEAAERLHKEACATARVSHPSIVRVFDVGTSEVDGRFLVMELLQGPTLSDTLAARGHFTPEEAALLVLPIVGAAAAAHAEGIVHRDIKPQNVMLVDGEDGALVPKLIDFGVAHLVSEPASTRITQAGTLLGSPEYMAPEQARAEHDIDAQTDVWALCVLFYELVAGTTPFRRETSLATLAAIVSDEPACPDALRDEPELWCILRRGLVRDRSERWGSARGLGRQLAVWAIGRGIEADAAGTSLASSWLGKRHTPLPPKPPQAEKRTVRAA